MSAEQRPLVAFLAAAAMLASSCASPRPPERPPLRIVIHADPLGLDPYARNEALSFAVLRNFYEALTSFDPEMGINPALAESWENPDELTWIFRLRRGVRFHDGRELTAADVVFSLERARQPGSSFSSYLVAVQRIRALDRYSVELTTSQPYAILLSKLAFLLIVPAGSPPQIRDPIGTGPYQLAGYQPGKRITLRAFPQYWGKPPPEPRVELLPIVDARERVALLAHGAADLVQDPGTANLQQIQAIPHCRLQRRESLAVAYLLLRTDRPPLSDLKVRRAIDLALDRTALATDDLNGEGRPIGQMVSRSVFGFVPGLQPTTADRPQAVRLLAAAGYPQGIDLDLEYRRGRPTAALLLQLHAAGIRLRPVERSWAEISPRLHQHAIPFYLGSVLAPSADSSDLLDAMVHSPRGIAGYGDSNYADYHNAELDALIEQSGSTLNMEARRDQLERAMRLLMDDLVFIPLYVPFAIYGTRDDVVWSPRRDGFVLAEEVRRR